MALRCAILVLWLATPAHADTILDMRSDLGWRGNLIITEPGFSLSSSVSINGGLFKPEQTCNPCMPGALIGIGAAWSGSDFGGSVTVNGQGYDLDGSVFFHGSSVVAPELDGLAMLQAPFMLEGVTMLDDVAYYFGGLGTATLFLERVRESWRVDRVSYQISTPATDTVATPEPASLFLIGAGLLALARYGRGRDGRTGA